jgi:hypothetical protein
VGAKVKSQDVEPLVERRLRFPASIAALVARTAKERRMSESAVFRILVQQGIAKSREDWSGRD